MFKRSFFQKNIFILLLICLGLITLPSLSGKSNSDYNKYGTGGLVVKKAFQQTFPEAQAAASSIAHGSSLPPRVDLSAKMPPPGNQGRQGSCTAWAVAYASHSYLVGKYKKWDLSRKAHQFSPAFVFNQLTHRGRGIHIHKAMQLLVNQGCSTLDQMPYSDRNYTRRPTPQARQKAWLYRARSWKRVRPNDQHLIKQKLHDGNVVVAAMYVYKRFYRFRSHNNVYKDVSNGGHTPYGKHGRHAVTVVGYDDNKYGGAFKLLNSWGSHWGKKGYFWIKYNYWNRVVYDAYILYSKKGVSVNTRPNAPQNISATTGLNNKIIISWDKSQNADGYTIYRFHNSTQNWIKMGNTSRLFFEDKTAHPGILYKYSVKAFNKNGQSKFSVYANGKRIKRTLAEKIARPRGLHATKHLTDRITLTWEKVRGAIAYKIYRWHSNRWVFKARARNNSWTDRNITKNKLYYYSVASVGKSSTSKRSKFISGKAVRSSFEAKPLKPDNFTVSRNSSKYIKISWNRVRNAQHYVLYRWRASNKKWYLLKKTKRTYYYDYTSRANVKTYYSVAAVNSSGRSEFTNFKYGIKKSKSDFTKGKDIPRIEELRVSKGQFSDRVTVQWENFGNPYSYFVFRWRQKTKKWKQLAKVYNNSYIDRTARRGEVYYYSIRAAIGRRYGAASDPLPGYTSNDESYFKGREFDPSIQRKKPSTPTSLRGSYNRSHGSVVLRWRRSSGATRYLIYKWNPRTRKWAAAGWSNTNYYYDRNVVSGRSYFYAVYARNKFGFSRPTKHIKVTTGYRSNNRENGNNNDREE